MMNEPLAVIPVRHFSMPGDSIKVTEPRLAGQTVTLDFLVHGFTRTVQLDDKGTAIIYIGQADR